MLSHLLVICLPVRLVSYIFVTLSELLLIVCSSCGRQDCCCISRFALKCRSNENITRKYMPESLHLLSERHEGQRHWQCSAVQCFATLPAENAVFNPSSQALSWSFGFERSSRLLRRVARLSRARIRSCLWREELSALTPNIGHSLFHG